MVQREHSEHCRNRRRDHDVSHVQNQPVQPRSGQAFHEHRYRHFRPAEHGLVGDVRNRQRVAKPAGIRRVALRPAWPARGCGQLGQRFSADHLSGCSVARLGRPHPQSQQPGRGQFRSATPFHRRHQSAQPETARGHGRPGDQHPHRLVRDGLSHAVQRAGVDGSFQGIQGHARPLWHRSG